MEKSNELEKLALPLYEWLLKNYDPMCSIIIEYGKVRIVRDETQAVLPIDD